MVDDAINTQKMSDALPGKTRRELSTDDADGHRREKQIELLCSSVSSVFSVDKKSFIRIL
jgi:hypothetical protein